MAEIEASFRRQPTKCKHCGYIVAIGDSFTKHIVCNHYDEFLEKIFRTLSNETQKEITDKIFDQFE